MKKLSRLEETPSCPATERPLVGSEGVCNIEAPFKIAHEPLSLVLFLKQ